MKSKIKAIIVAAMLATTAMTAQSAYASDPVFSVDYDAEGGFSGVIGHSFTAPTPSFTDYYSFNLEQSFNTSTSITSTFTQSSKGTKDVNISGFDLIQVDTAGNYLTVYEGTNNTATVGAHPMDSWSLSADGLSAGTYYLRITGAVVGTTGGSYGGEISVLPVPEPETYGMMLGGLALVGLVARRKAAKKAAQA
jgi:hypothetical protein